jgi:hypothetical protein
VSPAVYAEAHYAVGMLYWLGQGVKEDYLEASEWWRKAAALGHGGAQGKLGYLYSEGITVERDYQQAFEWFDKAAKQGDVDGQYNLGIFYLNGWGVERDTTMAAQYLAAASAQGDVAAERALQDLLPELARAGGAKQAVDREGGPRIKSGVTKPEPGVTKPESGVTKPEPGVTKPEPGDPGTAFETPGWILAQDPNHYTIQVIGLSSMSRLEDLVRGHERLAPFAVYAVNKADNPLYLLVQGVYADAKSARVAAARFPAAIQAREELWIRKFGKVQETILAERN